jgi:hypothetical protein
MEKAASMFAGCKLHTNTAHTQKHTHKTRSRFDFLCGDTKTKHTLPSKTTRIELILSFGTSSGSFGIASK